MRDVTAGAGGEEFREVGLLRELTGGYTGMFVLVYLGVAGLFVTGWLVCADRQVDDEVPGLGAWSPSAGEPTVEVAGAESPVVVEGQTSR